MKPTVSLHNVAKLDIGPISHFGPEPGRPTHFWTRTLTVRDENGDYFTIPIFSGKEDGLLTQDERKVREDQEAQARAYAEERLATDEAYQTAMDGIKDEAAMREEDAAVLRTSRS